MTAAYWISPKEDMIEVEISHIQIIINHPSKFGLTKKLIERVYRRHKEPLGLEGNAREEIICDLVKKDWIRTRIYTNKYWSITVKKLDRRNKTFLCQWASKILKTGIEGAKEKDKYMPVRIVQIGAEKICEGWTVEDIAKGKLDSHSVI